MGWQSVEEEVRAIAEAVWSSPCRSEQVAGTQCDGVVHVRKDYLVLIEISVRDDLAKLRDDVDKLHNLQGTLDMIHQTQKDIMAVQNHCFRKIGFVKYNAFDNIGNNLSFAFTVLDGKNDGFCLSSVYGRNESRIFAKPIVEGKCLYGMSEEERESLDNALNYSGDMQAVQKDLEE